ncbi:MAG TPA: hypothetical protein ENG00_00695 [Candidatus Aenigmarchaeota archaeon]|nr:hypothetical protein [Candidatus Aenigmarchaeota archaeon]
MKGKVVKTLTLMAFLILLLIAMGSLHPAGKPVNTEMDDYFIRNGQVQTGSNNIVSSVVFDYRGFDTLGEATVLFGAALGVFVLFGRNAR